MKGPLPLRNEQHVKGFPSLRGKDLARVRSANMLCDLVAAMCEVLASRQVPWSIENPESSLLWQYPAFLPLLPEAFEVVLHTCMFGSPRQKKTKLLSSVDWFSALAVECDGSHPHQPWGRVRKTGATVWSTSLESAYNRPLSKAWA